MSKQPRPSIKLFREGAGVLAAFIIVMAFIAVGFMQMGTIVVFDIVVSAPDSWFSGLLSLSSAALGYLIGKNVDRDQHPVYDENTPMAAAHDCPHCGMPIVQEQHDGTT